jgi:hypothetical protein
MEVKKHTEPLSTSLVPNDEKYVFIYPESM